MQQQQPVNGVVSVSEQLAVDPVAGDAPGSNARLIQKSRNLVQVAALDVPKQVRVSLPAMVKVQLDVALESMTAALECQNSGRRQLQRKQKVSHELCGQTIEIVLVLRILCFASFRNGAVVVRRRFFAAFHVTTASSGVARFPEISPVLKKKTHARDFSYWLCGRAALLSSAWVRRR
ncbi:Hypothetical protein UVM_LOCUS435 [uncultured virus]|nr:Hypothetical protein UVM_LOCUS435 [uncultured virus]